LKSLDSNKESKFEVQGRFVHLKVDVDVQKRSPKSKAKTPVTVTRGYVIREEGLPTVQIDVPNDASNKCPIELYVDGHRRDIFQGTGLNSVVVRQIGETVVIYYPETQVQFTTMIKATTKYGCFLSTQVCLPEDYRPDEQIIGLLGTPDDDKTNEWMKADGSPVPNNGKYNQGSYEYCTQHWCIHEESKSMFTYDLEKDESFETFYKCPLPYDDSLNHCLSAPPSWAAEICADDDRCIFECCAGGEEACKIAIDVEIDLSENNKCSEQVYVEDFDTDDVSGWDMGVEVLPSGKAFLGRFHQDSEPVSREFDIPEFADRATVEFLLYEIDDWSSQCDEASVKAAKSGKKKSGKSKSGKSKSARTRLEGG
jgi:hypothetical protein